MTLDRRQFLATGLAGGAAALVGRAARTPQPEALRIGVLTPLTGGGAVYGTTMSRMYTLVADEINKAGGIGGKPIQLFTEDDQTNPDAGVRGARKLVDVNRCTPSSARGRARSRWRWRPSPCRRASRTSACRARP